MQKGLGGYTSDIEASATEGSALLDASGLEAQLGSFDGSDVTTGATTDNKDVALVRRGGGEGTEGAKAAATGRWRGRGATQGVGEPGQGSSAPGHGFLAFALLLSVFVSTRLFACVSRCFVFLRLRC